MKHTFTGYVFTGYAFKFKDSDYFFALDEELNTAIKSSIFEADKWMTKEIAMSCLDRDLNCSAYTVNDFELVQINLEGMYKKL